MATDFNTEDGGESVVTQEQVFGWLCAAKAIGAAFIAACVFFTLGALARYWGLA